MIWASVRLPPFPRQPRKANARYSPTEIISDVCLYQRMGPRIFRRGMRTQQCNRHFPRPTPSHFANCILQMPVAARVNEVNLSLASSLFETFSAVLRTPHRRRLHRGNVGRSSLAQTPSVLLHGSRSLRSQGRYLPHSQDWTLQLRQVLHCDPRLLSVGGGGGFLRWCMAYPALGAILLGWHGAARECFRRAASSPARFSWGVS
jgi:hypothetical protein